MQILPNQLPFLTSICKAVRLYFVVVARFKLRHCFCPLIVSDFSHGKELDDVQVLDLTFDFIVRMRHSETRHGVNFAIRPTWRN